jgi:hypothetical protein
MPPFQGSEIVGIRTFLRWASPITWISRPVRALEEFHNPEAVRVSSHHGFIFEVVRDIHAPGQKMFFSGDITIDYIAVIYYLSEARETTHYSLLTTHYSPLITHHSLLITHHSPLITHHSPLITHYYTKLTCQFLLIV